MSTIYLLSQHNTTEKFKSPEKNKASAEALALNFESVSNQVFIFIVLGIDVNSLSNKTSSVLSAIFFISMSRVRSVGFS